MTIFKNHVIRVVGHLSSLLQHNDLVVRTFHVQSQVRTQVTIFLNYVCLFEHVLINTPIATKKVG